MAVVACGHCRMWYWRYNGQHPPSGYCSLLCYESRKRKASTPLFSAPYYRAKIQEHRREFHGTDDVLAWFDCPGCERIEAEYQRSLTR